MIASRPLNLAVPRCRADLVQYFSRVHAALDHKAGSIFVMDLLGGHAAESVSKLWRVNEQTGAHHLPYMWLADQCIPCLLCGWLGSHVIVRSMLLPGRHMAASCSAAGLAYLWEQVRFDPIRRRLVCELTLRDPGTGKVRSALCTLCGAGRYGAAAAASWAAKQWSRVEEKQCAPLRVPLLLLTW